MNTITWHELRQKMEKFGKLSTSDEQNKLPLGNILATSNCLT